MLPTDATYHLLLDLVHAASRRSQPVLEGLADGYGHGWDLNLHLRDLGLALISYTHNLLCLVELICNLFKCRLAWFCRQSRRDSRTSTELLYIAIQLALETCEELLEVLIIVFKQGAEVSTA